MCLCIHVAEAVGRREGKVRCCVFDAEGWRQRKKLRGNTEKRDGEGEGD